MLVMEPILLPRPDRETNLQPCPVGDCNIQSYPSRKPGQTTWQPWDSSYSPAQEAKQLCPIAEHSLWPHITRETNIVCGQPQNPAYCITKLLCLTCKPTQGRKLAYSPAQLLKHSLQPCPGRHHSQWLHPITEHSLQPHPSVGYSWRSMAIFYKN